MSARSPLLEQTAGGLYCLLLAASVWLLLRGHDAPGGGFIAGLVAVAGSALLAIVHGVERARRRLPLAPAALAAAGVLLALASGLPAVLSGQPFLTHLWGSIAGLKLSTVLVFDLGVLCTVWGAFSAYLFALLADRGDAP